MVELLVATVCLAVTALGILTAIGFTDRQNILARQRLCALSYATSEMELYKSKAYYGTIAAGVYSTSLVSTALPQPAARITTVTATADPKVFTVTVQVEWTVMTASGPTVRTVHMDSALRNSDAS